MYQPWLWFWWDARQPTLNKLENRHGGIWKACFFKGKVNTEFFASWTKLGNVVAVFFQVQSSRLSFVIVEDSCHAASSLNGDGGVINSWSIGNFSAKISICTKSDNTLQDPTRPRLTLYMKLPKKCQDNHKSLHLVIWTHLSGFSYRKSLVTSPSEGERDPVSEIGFLQCVKITSLQRGKDAICLRK